MLTDDHCEVVLERTGDNDADWLAARRDGISGSDALAAMGADERKQRAALWIEKTQDTPPQPESERMWMGTLLEPVVKQAFTRKTGIEVHDNPYLLRSVAYPWMLATPDGYVHDPDLGLGLFEAKTTNVWLKEGWAEGNIPARAAAQTMHYMAVCGVSYAYVAVLADNLVEWRLIERDDALVDEIIRLEREFWGYVERREMPPIEVGAGDSGDLIAAQWPTADDGTWVDADDHAGTVRAYLEANREYARWKKRREELGQEVRLLAKDAAEIRLGGEPWLTYKHQPRTDIDVELLRSEYPDVAAAVTRTTTTRPLRATKHANQLA